MMNKKSEQNGSMLVTVLIIMTFLMIVILSLMLLSNLNLARARERILLLQTQYVAETGIDVGLSQLNQGLMDAYAYGAETEILKNGGSYRATYQVKMDDGSSNNEKIITTIGRVYSPSSDATAKYSRTVRIVAKRTSNNSSASIISRNIIHIASSVKQVIAKDLFVNEYIQLDKNVNELVVENLTIADKASGAGNCSISGPGKITKPASFTNPSQTKTVLNLAYKNCVLLTAPSTDYIVNEDKTDIEKVQSTYIPWNYNMDNTYVAAGSCNDWTSGSTRTIPSTGNDLKTHYPDSSSGVDPSCGTSGTVNLGTSTVIIKDNAHLRANLCDPSSPCAPTFNNTSSSTKFIFIEGSLSLGAFKTTVGSKPIVFVVYGGDPAELNSVCPLGGAVYLDKTTSDNVDAPAAYLIAVNGGLCANGTKFGASRSLGGVSGKNVYISTNSGTPFDLSFDPTFPVNEIPINLTWKVALYERIR